MERSVVLFDREVRLFVYRFGKVNKLVFFLSLCTLQRDDQDVHHSKNLHCKHSKNIKLSQLSCIRPIKSVRSNCERYRAIIRRTTWHTTTPYCNILFRTWRQSSVFSHASHSTTCSRMPPPHLRQCFLVPHQSRACGVTIAFRKGVVYRRASIPISVLVNYAADRARWSVLPAVL
jgi:hypothetical protein